jgi:hypothetical protein
MGLKNRELYNNNNDLYRKKFENRSVKYITQYKTPTFSQITDEMLEDIDFFNYAWTRGDSWQYIADKFYDSPKDWKYLALFNKKPTEAHISVGDVIRLPRSIEDLKERLG